MTDLTEKLKMVELYCENQGDKFHPLSDEILSMSRAAAPVENKEIAIREHLTASANTFPYHVKHMTETLDYEDTDY